MIASHLKLGLSIKFLLMISFHILLLKLHWKKRWSLLPSNSCKTCKAHLPYIPQFTNFTPVERLSWATGQAMKDCRGIAMGCHIKCPRFYLRLAYVCFLLGPLPHKLGHFWNICVFQLRLIWKAITMMNGMCLVMGVWQLFFNSYLFCVVTWFCSL